MNSAQTYFLLAKCLALDFVKDHRQTVIAAFEQNQIDIQEFVRIADNHLVLQSIYPILEKHQLTGILPDALAGHLKKIFNLNSERNKKILHQIESINSLLLREEITPLYLKGSGNILDGLYVDPGERILHDIDFLVEEKDFTKTVETLLKNEYTTYNPIDPKTLISQKHYPILRAAHFPAYVEIHKFPVRTKFLKGFSTETIFDRKILPVNSAECFVMCDEHKLIHNFIHSQLEKDGHYYARSFLRDLYDAMLLSYRVNTEQAFSIYGHYRRQTSAYLNIMYKSFGIEPPAGNTPKIDSLLFSFRYKLNLKSRLISQTSSLVLRMFLSYIKNPFMAFRDKDLRISMIKKLRDRRWYRKHLRDIFGKIKL